MATLPLNTFKTITNQNISGANQNIYTCPVGVTAIILMAQISNIDPNIVGQASFAHVRQNIYTYLVKDASIPTQDALNPLSGRLVLQSGDSIVISSSTGTLQILISLVESANA
jgi:hypothetical protein